MQILLDSCRYCNECGWCQRCLVADMDGDDMDIFFFCLDDTIAWYENDGNAGPTWTAANIATTADGTYEVFVANRRWRYGYLIYCYQDSTIAWYENDGNADATWTAYQLADGAVRTLCRH